MHRRATATGRAGFGLQPDARAFLDQTRRFTNRTTTQWAARPLESLIRPGVATAKHAAARSRIAGRYGSHAATRYHVDESCRQIRTGRASPAAAILPTEIPLDVELGRRADVLLDHGNSALLNLELLVEQVLNAEFHAQSVRRIEGVNEVQGVDRLLVSVRRAVAP